MKKITKKFSKFFALALAMMMIGAMFAMPASAHDHAECDQTVQYYIINGKIIDDVGMRRVVTCGCSNPNYEDYLLEEPHNYKRTDHYVSFIQICTNCGWEYSDVAIAVGGCGFFCDLPYYYDYYSE